MVQALDELPELPEMQDIHVPEHDGHAAHA